MMYSVAVTPSITGIITSIVITSGRSRRHSSVAVRPSRDLRDDLERGIGGDQLQTSACAPSSNRLRPGRE